MIIVATNLFPKFPDFFRTFLTKLQLPDQRKEKFILKKQPSASTRVVLAMYLYIFNKLRYVYRIEEMDELWTWLLSFLPARSQTLVAMIIDASREKKNKQINKQKQWFLSSVPFDIRIITQKSNFSL